ncbi:MAG: APC family permease [Brevinematales bacterium]
MADKRGTSEPGERQSIFTRLRSLIIGEARNPEDRSVFHKLSLIAVFAWIGLGADALSSSCYGPEEAFRVVLKYPFLGLFVGIATSVTIIIISASYSQIIKLFPGGGGGYIVASKLLSPSIGMVAGCALMVDYVLTIAVSIASGADAIFSFMPGSMLRYKIYFSAFCILVLIIMNLRGVKESVSILAPIFILFILTHTFLILYGFFVHVSNLPVVADTGYRDLARINMNLGLFGAAALFLKAYGMGAGTYTGIESVSNAISILREPRVQTAKTTMVYMAASLTFMAFGIMVIYLLYGVSPVPGKTLNAISFEAIMKSWPPILSNFFLLITLISEAVLLFVAAQGGFLAGPRVLSNMAVDKWMPSRYTQLSNRLVTENGVLLMGVTSLLILIVTGGSIDILIILYSINVFITFNLSQLGMVKHWWSRRKSGEAWFGKMLVNGVGLVLCIFILISFLVTKLNEGGWVTLLITGALVAFSLWVKKEYGKVQKQLNRLNSLVEAVENSEHISKESFEDYKDYPGKYDKNDKTAVLLVNGYNGTGLHILFGIQKLLGFSTFKNYVFIQVGVVDSNNFKSADEVDGLKKEIQKSVNSYAVLMRKTGFYTQTFTSLGTDAEDQILKTAPEILKEFPNSIFFGGQLVFSNTGLFTKFMNNLLHNNLIFTLHEKLYYLGIPFVLLPIRI